MDFVFKPSFIHILKNSSMIRSGKGIFTARFDMFSNHTYSQCAIWVTKRKRKGCDADMRCSVCNNCGGLKRGGRCGIDKAGCGSFNSHLFNIWAGIGLKNDRDRSDLMMKAINSTFTRR